MGSAFHQLCPRYSGTLTPTAPTAIRLWDTFTFTLVELAKSIPVRSLILSHCPISSSVCLFFFLFSLCLEGLSLLIFVFNKFSGLIISIIVLLH